MSSNDWEKSPNDRKEEAFHATDESKKTRSKTSKRSDRPFLVESKYTSVRYTFFEAMLEWHGNRKFATVELAKTYVKKLKRESRANIREFRITDTRDGSIHALD